MSFTCLYEEILMTEGAFREARPLGSVESHPGSASGARMQSLGDVKRDLADQARRLGANAIQHFTYGQKHKWAANDDVAFWAKGIAVRIPEDVYAKYASREG